MASGFFKFSATKSGKMKSEESGRVSWVKSRKDLVLRNRLSR